MRESRVSALTAPLPATYGEEVCTVRAIDAHRNGRNEWADFTATRRCSSAGKRILEELAYLSWGIGEVARVGIAVVRSNDQPAPGSQSFNKPPKVIAAKLLGRISAQGF